MKFAGFCIHLFILLLAFSYSYSKELIFNGSSTLKQTKFILRDGEKIFAEKYQNVNGQITENWYVSGVETDKEDYFKQMENADAAEKTIEKEDREKKRQEEEEKKRQFLEEKERVEKEFRRTTRLYALKKLVDLELIGVQKAFKNLDKYDLQDYFVFEQDTFNSEFVLENVKVGLVNRAKEIAIRSFDELKKGELKTILEELEVVPAKVERFFRKSVQYAINKCNDTKRLKELLSLI